MTSSEDGENILIFLDFCGKDKIEEYRKRPDKFLEDIFDMELLPCQKAFIKSIMKEIQNDKKEIYQIAYGRRYRA